MSTDQIAHLVITLGMGAIFTLGVGLGNYFEGKFGGTDRWHSRLDRDKQRKFGARAILVTPIWPLAVAYYVVYFLVVIVLLKGLGALIRDADVLGRRVP